MTASSVTGTAAGDGAAGEVAAGPFATADADDAVRAAAASDGAGGGTAEVREDPSARACASVCRSSSR